MQFKFSGCEENENNFNSQEECQRACPIEGTSAEIHLYKFFSRNLFLPVAK